MRLMKAALLDGPQHALRVAEIPVPSPGPKQLLVKLAASGVCHTDVHVWQRNELPTGCSYPLILGHEGVGEIVELGSDVIDWKIGDCVGVPWLHQTCGRCAECLEGAESFCQTQTAHGFHVNGTFAEFLVVNSAFAAKLPYGLNPVAVAPLMCAGLTAFGAIKKANLSHGQNCAIFGCGGLGLYAIQLAARAGASVTAVDVTVAKLDLALKAGANQAVLVNDQAVMKLTANGGMHAAINFAPTVSTWPMMISSIRPRGRLIAAAMVEQDVNLNQEWLTYTGVTITGTSVGTRHELQELIKIHEQQPLHCETTSIRLADINDALLALKNGEVSGRLVIDFR